jgi:hypothetical protein
MLANSALVNAHINRVMDDGGDPTTIDQTWLQTAYTWLTSNSVDKSLLHWADPAFGIAKSGSNITRIYDLGTTWLPRSMDLTPRDSAKTTYNATGLNSLIPAFVNSDGSSQLYWGRNNRYNQIRFKQQLTIAALYARTQTSSNICFVGTATSSTPGNRLTSGGNYNFDMTPKFNGPLVPGISLVHTSGRPGIIEFSLSDKSAISTTASVTASGARTQIAIGTYDGETMTAYSDATGGRGNTALFRDPLFAGDQALAGCRKGSSIDNPVLCIGDTKAFASYLNSNEPPYNAGSVTMTSPNLAYANATFTYTNAYAQFKASSIIVLGVGLDSTLAISLYNLLKTRAGL